MGGGSQSTGEGFSRTDPGFMTELGTILNQSMTGTSGFSKKDALNDVQGLMLQQATNMMQESLPKIAGSERAAGAYGSTTRQLLNNDLQARIAGQMMATQSQAIKDYAAIDADRIRAAAAATQAGTSTYSEHFENASSRKGWGSLLEGIGGAVVGGGLDRLAGSPDTSKVGRPSSFANGGVVPSKPQDESLFDEVVKRLGLEKAAQAADPSRRDFNKPLIKAPETRDEKMQIEVDKLKTRTKPKLVVDSGDDIDPLYAMIGSI